MNIKKLLICGSNKLNNIGIKSSMLESRILMQHATNQSLKKLLTNLYIKISQQQVKTFFFLISRRLLLEPISYIIGYKEFFGYKFIVNSKVLIPRNDTEVIVEAVIKNISHNPKIKILELGIGSGCISISLLLKIPGINITATDISIGAIKIACQNAINHKVKNRLKIINSNWFQSIPLQRFDVIISNPPYISYNEVSYMSKETIKYEPTIALFAKNNGLFSYLIIAQNAKNYLKKDGKLFLEVGFNQMQSVKKIFIKNNYKCIRVHQDLQGINRVLLITI